MQLFTIGVNMNGLWSMMYDTAHMSACIVLLCTADIMCGAGQFV